MGHLLVIWRLAVRDIRRYPVEALIPLIAVTVAVATLTVGLGLTTSTETAYVATKEATAGPDVIATTVGDTPLPEKLSHAPGVVAYAGPYFAFSTTIRVRGFEVRSAVEGRDKTAAAVDQPVVTEGTWVEDGGAVIERGFAQVMGVRVRDVVTVNGRSLTIVGIAVSAASGVYPGSDNAQGRGPTDRGGKIWVTAADARAASGGAVGVRLLYLKLADPAATKDFVRSISTADFRGDTWTHYATWQQVVEEDTRMIRFMVPTLVVGGWLIAIAAAVGLAALVTLRAARYNRRAGLLKAVGATPSTVAAVLLAQTLPSATAAAVLGLVVGTFVAPQLTDPSAGLISTVSAPTFGTIVAAAVLALLIALASTLGPVVRAARRSTVSALADGSAESSHALGLSGVMAHLPTSLLLGMQLIARRPGRALSACFGTAATAAMVTALMIFRTQTIRPLSFGVSSLEDVRGVALSHVLTGVTLALGALSILNTLVIGWSAAHQARRPLTVARTLGATPGQIVTALCVVQVLAALPGLAVGVPTGLFLYWIVSVEMPPPPVTSLVIAALALLLTVAATAALPAWAHTRRPAGVFLKSDAV
ncbi:MAG: FtsX-like permease family protein [Hamadaea sp.]|uniref:FtsX-like permease family protein n=1 Tax=Hamadaea sp. TaxID=2024425 RepID=UPI0018333F1C|nr:FtsX-like permease family protein [Hamadaea sp.]NUR74421.1 FtsX-like permease family protein [Hamadaea sp.]NUT22927.1 FtsX-like permease family protein [Hamadaea sp.]